MMGANAMSPADVAAVVDNNRSGYGYGDGMFGGWMWIIVLLFLFRGNNWGYNGGESPLVSEEFIKRDIFNTNQNVSNTACQTQRDVLENRYTTQLGLQQVQAAQQACCCETGNKILESRYTTQLGFQGLGAQLAQCCCDITTAIHAEGEATRGLIQSNTIQDLRDKLEQSQRENLTNTLVSSNQAQTQNLIGTLRPYPVPSYITCSPYVPYGYNGCGCNTGCGC